MVDLCLEAAAGPCRIFRAAALFLCFPAHGLPIPKTLTSGSPFPAPDGSSLPPSSEPDKAISWLDRSRRNFGKGSIICAGRLLPHAVEP